MNNRMIAIDEVKQLLIKRPLTRMKLSGSMFERKKFFRTGYPPSGSVFDVKFYEKRKTAYSKYSIFIDEIEDFWEKVQLSIGLSYSNSWGDSFTTVIEKKGFQNRNLNLLSAAAVFLDEQWRIKFARFWYQYWDEQMSAQQMWVGFLLKESNPDEVSDEELKLFFNSPMEWMISMTIPFVLIKNEEVL